MEPNPLMFDILTPGEGRGVSTGHALDISSGPGPCDARDKGSNPTGEIKGGLECPRVKSLVFMGGSWRPSQSTGPVGLRLRPRPRSSRSASSSTYRAARGRRLGAARARRQDHDRPVRQEGGVEGYKIEAIYADAQSKPDVAINEAVRLIEQEKVDMLLGFYSSAQCVPAAARVEQLKKFMWITTCISSAVLENRNSSTCSAAQPSGRQFGLMSTDFIAQNAKDKLGKEPKDLRVAIIHEDGAYGVDVSKGNEEGAKKAGFNVVLKEGYSATAPDLSPLVTKLKRAPARRHLPHRLQPGHLAVPAPGPRARPAVQRAGRPRGRLRRLRQAEGSPRQGRQLLLQRRSDLDLAGQREGAQARSCCR